MKHVLVVIQATEAGTESLALAFGLGAVEGGADIRLRHLACSAPTHLEHQGYGRLKEQDIEWAEAIGLAIESPAPADELRSFLEQVGVYRAQAGSLEKSAYLFGAAPQASSIRLAQEALEEMGFTCVKPELAAGEDERESLKAVGRQVAGLAHV